VGGTTASKPHPSREALSLTVSTAKPHGFAPVSLTVSTPLRDLGKRDLDLDQEDLDHDQEDHDQKDPAASAPVKGSDVVTWAQLPNGGWGLSGTGLRSGQRVTVTKRDGTTDTQIVGTIVRTLKTGKTLATLGVEEPWQPHGRIPNAEETAAYLVRLRTGDTPPLEKKARERP
jgi:hypothetical protein